MGIAAAVQNCTPARWNGYVTAQFCAAAHERVNAIDSKKWSNLLAVVELLFCLPIANGRVERVFSLLKLIKDNQRT